MPILKTPCFGLEQLTAIPMQGDWSLRIDEPRFIQGDAQIPDWPRPPRVLFLNSVPLFPARSSTASEWHHPLAEQLIRWVNLAAARGVGSLVIEFESPYRATDDSVRTYQEGLNHLARALRDTVSVINRTDVRLAVVARRGSFLMSPPEARELLDQTLCPRFGVGLPVTTHDDRAILQDWMNTLGPRLFSIVVDVAEKDREQCLQLHDWMVERWQTCVHEIEFLIPSALW